MKDAAVDDIFKSAMSVVEEHIQSVIHYLHNMDSMARKANRYKQTLRPEDPKGADFNLAEDLLPDGFLQKDLTVDGARHLIFATQNQLDILHQAKTWYVDATFKVLRTKDTFEQLFGIHAFLKNDGNNKTGATCVHMYVEAKEERL